MTRIEFTQDGETWWFDPEKGEYEYDGPNALIRVLLDNLSEYAEKQTETLWGVDEHPGEQTIPLSPEERKEKVLNYLTRVNGVEVHERQTTNH